MGKHKFLTYDKSNKSDKEGHANKKSKNFGGRHKQFKHRTNPISQINAKPQESTPWLKLKEAFREQEKEIEKKKKHSRENGSEKSEFLDKRNKSYNQFLIKEKQKEETSWEDFSSEAPENYDLNKEMGTYKANPKQLSENAKQHFKRVITSTTIRAKGSSFESCLNDLKARVLNKKNI